MFQKGKSGNPGGAWRDKPFREALRLELSSAGHDLEALRLIARALIANAQNGDIQAVKEVADRMDGKSTQESTVTIDDKRSATDWTRNELVAFLDESRSGRDGIAQTNGRGGEPDKIH